MIMSVTVIDKESFILADYHTPKSKNQSKQLLLHKQNEVKSSPVKSENNESNLCHDNHIDSDSIIHTIQETPKKEGKRKRLSNSSSSEYSSYSSSPEIKSTPPVQYTLFHMNDTKIVLKKTMNRKTRLRNKKFNDEEIASLLETDDENNIYNGGEKTNDANENLLNEEKPRHVRQRTLLRLRRSTEHSHYNAETIEDDVCGRRASLRSTISTPIRYRDENETNIRILPNKSTSSKLHNDNFGSPQVESPQKTKKSKQKNDKQDVSIDIEVKKLQTTSDISILKSIPTTPSGRKLRTPRFNLVDTYECDGHETDEMNKENESDESYDSDESKKITKIKNKTKPESKHSMTPRSKGKSITNIKTPKRITRRTSRIDEEDEETISYDSPKKISQIIEEPVTPKRKITVVKTQTPSVKIGSLTPSVRLRKSIVEKPKTIFETARARLHVSAVPKSLPCREKEFNDVFMFLEKKLADQSAGCMYISGVPGTGKTATVNEAIRCLRKLVARGTIQDFDFIEVNGMKLSEPRQAYVQILRQLTGETATWEVARSAIEKKLTNPNDKKSMTLLLVDELDILCNKRQDVVYNILDWPSQPSVKLVVITIANTMDLPERVLMSRVTSRLGLTRLTFHPYNHKQLQEIVVTRLNESDAFESDAIQLVARKVAAVSGDARRALDICRRATEIAEFNNSEIVSIKHVNEALTQMIANAKVRAIMHCSEMEKIFLQAICAEIKRTGVEETTFTDIYKQMDALCSFEGEKTPNITETLEICSRLNASRLILCDDARKDIYQRIFLNVSSDDIHFALSKIEL